jgi:hypothetical protein
MRVSIVENGNFITEHQAQRQPLPPGVTLFEAPRLTFSREQPEDAYLPTRTQASKIMPLTTSNVYIGPSSPVFF